jgi:hypothetical protein
VCSRIPDLPVEAVPGGLRPAGTITLNRQFEPYTYQEGGVSTWEM